MRASFTCPNCRGLLALQPRVRVPIEPFHPNQRFIPHTEEYETPDDHECPLCQAMLGFRVVTLIGGNVAIDCWVVPPARPAPPRFFSP